jgi:CHAD domain-containing protein
VHSGHLLEGRFFSTVAQPAVNNPEKTGLAYWMDRVLEQHSKLNEDWSPEPVHDLRVALRRCILIADVMRNLDPGASWKPVRKAGRRLFRQLGTSRDTQVLAEWVQKLGSPEDASTLALLEELKGKHEQNRAESQKAAKEFDRKQWRAWSRELASRFRHVASNKSACEALMLQLWEAVRDSHCRAQRNRSGVAYHRTRVELKKFRYAVENFLPSMHSEWVADLKFLQDLLGEIHDLDVLSQIINKNKALSDETVRAIWTKKLQDERVSRLQQYRAKMAGKASLLWKWREGLPGDRELRSVGLAKLAEWAYFVTPNFPRVRRIARRALQLYDGFANCGLIGRDPNIEERFILHAAALLQEVGRFKRKKAHHKESYRTIRRVTPPVGWTKSDLELVALIARFHRRALPSLDHKALEAYQLPLRHVLLLLTGLLRMANGFSAKPYRAVRRLEVENCAGVIVVRAEGYTETDPLTPKLSQAKRLLEFASHRPVHILTPGAQIVAPRLVQPAAHSDAA